MPVYGNVDHVVQRTGLSPENIDANTDTQRDQFVERLLERASSRIENYTQREFGLEEDFEYQRYGNGSRTIHLGFSPVRNINEIKAGDKVIESDEYRVEKRKGTTRNSGRITRISGRWERDVEYEFDIDFGYSDEDRPKAIDDIAEEIAIAIINDTDAVRKAKGASSISMDGYSVDWDTLNVDGQIRLTKSMKNRLNKFKRVAFG